MFGQSAPPNVPGPGAPNAGDAAPESITITKQPDGSITCDDGSGEEPSTHASIEEALDYAKQKLGGGSDEDQGHTAPPEDEAPDFSGAYSKG